MLCKNRLEYQDHINAKTKEWRRLKDDVDSPQTERIMFSGKQIGMSGILIVAGLLGGCANPDASVSIVNDTSESIVLEPVVKTAFISEPQEQIELAPGEEWQHSWDLSQGSWVLVRFVRPGDINSLAAGSLHLRTVKPGQALAFRATPGVNGALNKIVAE